MMNSPKSRTPRMGMLKISVKPGLPAIQLMATAITKKIRAGAGRISLEHFPSADGRLAPALVHRAGRSQASAAKRGLGSRRG